MRSYVIHLNNFVTLKPFQNRTMQFWDALLFCSTLNVTVNPENPDQRVFIRTYMRRSGLICVLIFIKSSSSLLQTDSGSLNIQKENVSGDLL